LAMHELLATERDLPVPGLVASGQLFDAAPAWPYLVTERMPGRAIREVESGEALGQRVAAELGAVVRRLHHLRPPDVVRQRELLGALRRDAPGRLRRFGLPEHLVEQVPDFLSDAEPAGILVHGDITADHVFVDGRGITALIDWGDALVADRAYELPAVYLDAFRGDRRLLAAFLDAARWPPGDLERRGLQGILEFQFDAITTIATSYDLTQVDSLEELAGLLFATHLGDRGTGEI
jgi:Ser/Thr protein kinase RdoA (MazF antagonist)